MTSRDVSERLGIHGKNLWTSIAKVEKLDKNLAQELGAEYAGLLEAISEVLDRMMKHLEH